MSELLQIFEKIKRPTQDSSGIEIFSGVQIPYAEQHHLGCDRKGRPVILLKMLDSNPIAPMISLENLRVEHNIDCRIITPSGKTVSGVFSLIHCISENESLKSYFLRVMDALLNSLSLDPTPDEIALAVDELALLFMALRKPSSKTIHGLWAEMFIIVESAKPVDMLKAWHQEYSEHFDFSSGLQRIEVKCSANRTRCHYFSLEQVYPPKGVSALIASLFIEQSSGGISLLELWNTIRGYASGNTELVMKVERIGMDTLGKSWSERSKECYDNELARESLRFYNINSIPRVVQDQPAGVSEVHFKSNIENTQPIEVMEYRNKGSLFETFFGGT